jgi:glucosylceramidase
MNSGGDYPSCAYSAAMEGAFVRDYLAPAFRKAGLATKIWVHDHDPDNKGGMARVNELLTMDGVADAIDGVAWHCYTSAATATNLAPVKAAHPKLRFYHTENGPHVVFNSWRTEWWWAEKVFGMLQNGCEMFASWCLCLDELGTPMTGSHLCAGFTVVDSTTHEVTYSPQYRLFRHIGPFVKRGARVMEVSGGRDGTRLILFRNPDGEYVLVVASDGALVRKMCRHRLVVKYKGRYKTLPLPGGQWSVSTLVFR